MSFRVDIPGLFHSEYHDGPFASCAVCGCDLLSGDTPYSISSTQNQVEAIVEMAVCEKCSDGLRDEMSDESKAAVAEFVESMLFDRAFSAVESDIAEAGVSPGKLLSLLEQSDEEPAEPMSLIDHCTLCRKPRSECRTYSVTAFCIGGEMIVQSGGPLSLGFPSMLCDDCNTEASSRLSKETREMWDRFYDQVIDTPPRITLDGPVPVLGI